MEVAARGGMAAPARPEMEWGIGDAARQGPGLVVVPRLAGGEPAANHCHRRGKVEELGGLGLACRGPRRHT